MVDSLTRLVVPSSLMPLLLAGLLLATSAFGQTKAAPAGFSPSPAFTLLDVALEATAREIDRVGARPTINSRELFLAVAALYDAWAAYDDRARPSLTTLDRAPPAERTDANRVRAMAAALRVVLERLYPKDVEWLRGALAKHIGDERSPAARRGARTGQQLIEARLRDGANQLGDERGATTAAPYGDYTFYAPVNGERVIDPDRWQPIPFTLDSGQVVRPGFLTPHWYRVQPYALTCARQFRPPPPPKVGSAQLAEEVSEVLRLNATLTPQQKAIVEFMRDGPRSTGQSGHWLRFAQAVSRRDRNDLSRDVKLFFAVGAACFDAFIAAWDAKRAYDSSRPWTLVRVLYAGKTVRGWLGPGRGVGDVRAEDWRPYSPASFVTPPFPGYVSGHSTVSAAAARTLARFTGSDRFEDEEARRAGTLTENGASHAAMQQVDGVAAKADERTCDVTLPLPTFTATAELAGISRVMGGYHIQADNLEGLKLGASVAEVAWQRSSQLFAGAEPAASPACP
ncbi:MAG: vanadium-dependent haloperoxidase [Myxococcaceae bacterium]|nr:vanadium-dependent haloperoxidase [Myxococcaceae bacterium]